MPKIYQNRTDKFFHNRMPTMRIKGAIKQARTHTHTYATSEATSELAVSVCPAAGRQRLPRTIENAKQKGYKGKRRITAK